MLSIFLLSFLSSCWYYVVVLSPMNSVFILSLLCIYTNKCFLLLLLLDIITQLPPADESEVIQFPDPLLRVHNTLQIARTCQNIYIILFTYPPCPLSRYLCICFFLMFGTYVLVLDCTAIEPLCVLS